jgi:hypothetical protein
VHLVEKARRVRHVVPVENLGSIGAKPDAKGQRDQQGLAGLATAFAQI